MKTNTRHALLSASAAVLLLTSSMAQAETDIAGVTAAVNPQATARDTAGKTRLISLGDPVIRNHRIETSSEGLVQILLADGTSFTVGPNSSVVIDSFVYDPDKNTASLAATMTKGALRFIGGKASKASGNVKIDTPIGTAGIRGAVVDINLNGQTPDGQPLPPHMTLVYGKEVQLSGNGAPQRLFRQGFSIVAGDGQPRVQRTPPQWVSGLQKVLAGRPGQSGGAGNTPTNETVANSTVSGSNSAQLPSENTIPVPTPRPIVSTPVEEVAGESQRDVGTRPEVPVDPVDPQPEEPWDGAAGAYALIEGDNGFRYRKITGTLATDQNGNLVGTMAALGSVSLQKPAASQTLAEADVSGSIESVGSVSGKAYTGSGEFIAYFLESDDSGEPIYMVGGKPADANEVFSASSVYRYVVERDPLQGSTTIGGVTVPFVGSFSAGEAGPIRAAASDLYVGGVSGDAVVARLLQGSLTISGVGSTQRSRIQVMAGSFKSVSGAYQMTGRTSGTYQTSDPTSNQKRSGYVETLGSGSGKDQVFGADGEYLVLGAGSLDDVESRENAYSAAHVASRDDGLTTPAVRSYSGEVRGFSAGAATNIWTDATSLFTGTTRLNFNSSNGTFNGSISSSSGNYFADFLANDDYEQSYLTDQLIAGVDSWGGAYMVSSAVVPAKIFNADSSSAICNACDFMTWGWWGKQSGPESSHSVHLGNWIIGRQPENSAMPSSGTATYHGNAVGTVVNDGAQYIATGSMTSTMDFGARNGSVSVANYDGKNFSASVAFGSGTPTFSGNSTGGVTASVTGAFASNGTDPVKGIMGNFTASDGAWSSTGIFAGSK